MHKTHFSFSTAWPALLVVGALLVAGCGSSTTTSSSLTGTWFGPLTAQSNGQTSAGEIYLDMTEAANGNIGGTVTACSASSGSSTSNGTVTGNTDKSSKVTLNITDSNNNTVTFTSPYSTSALNLAGSQSSNGNTLTITIALRRGSLSAFQAACNALEMTPTAGTSS
jgi:hypothetical protein